MATKSNLGEYVRQLKIQANNKNSRISADSQMLLNFYDSVLTKIVGKSARNMSVAELNGIPFDINGKSADHRKFWGSAGKLSYEESSHFLGIFGKKNRAKRDKLFGGVGKFVEKTTKTVVKGIGDAGKILGKIVTSPAIAALLPFKNAMKKALDKKGVSYKSKDMWDIAGKFVENIAKKKNYEGYEAYYVHTEERADFLPLVALIPVVLAFFKMLKDKQAAGALTGEEGELLTEVEKSQAEFDNNPAIYAKALQENNLATTSGGGIGGMDMKTVIILAVVAIVAFKMFK